MASQHANTATVADLFFYSILAAPCALTAAEMPNFITQDALSAYKTTSPLLGNLAAVPAITIAASNDAYVGVESSGTQHERLTTPSEMLVGEIRSWNLLAADWDGEGGDAPSTASIKEAVSFIHLLGDAALPEPQLLASGRISLFWNDGDRYAEIEFLGDRRMAYYIKRNGDKHKGVLAFDSQKIPDVFPVLLSA